MEMRALVYSLLVLFKKLTNEMKHLRWTRRFSQHFRLSSTLFLMISSLIHAHLSSRAEQLSLKICRVNFDESILV